MPALRGTGASLQSGPMEIPATSLAARIAACYPELPLPARPGLPAQSIAVPAGTVLFEEASPCRGFPLVLAGEIRVGRGTPGGRSIELYRVGPGEMCVVSAAALFGRAPMPAHGVASSAVELVLLGRETIDDWCADDAFRRHVFATFADRLADVIGLAEAVAFQRLDQRLAAALLGRGTVVAVTHQALAEELGTVREIVTRLLRRFERSGWVALARERIELRDAAALRRLADGGEPAGPTASVI